MIFRAFFVSSSWVEPQKISIKHNPSLLASTPSIEGFVFLETMEIVNFTSREKERYGELKAQIKQGWLMFAQGILEVRNSKLYRLEYGTFEDFCQSELGITDSYARKTISSAEVVANLENGTIVPLLPKTESQARPLSKLEPEVQREVWNETLETFGNDITAKKVEQIASEYKEVNEFVKEAKNEQGSMFVEPMTEKQILAKAKEIRRRKSAEMLKRREDLYSTLEEEKLSVSDKKYRVIYADPPWSYGNTMPDYVGTAEDHYLLMTLEDICNMPVKEIAADNSVLFLWTTSPHLEESFSVVNSWGFKYKTSFVWDKVKHNMGHYNSVRHEFLLVCTRGSCPLDVRRLFDSVVEIERGVSGQKPERFREIIETVYTHGNKIELFSRTKAEGWDLFGNEIGKHDLLK